MDYFLNMNISKKIFFIFLLIMMSILIFISVFAKYIIPFDPYYSDARDVLAKSDSVHIMGCDHMGRDLFSRIILGIQSSILISLITVLINFVIGTVLGIVAGYMGGKVKSIIMRFTDVMLAFPGLVLSIAIVGVLGQGVSNTIIALVISGWAEYARMSLALTISVKDNEYMKTAIFHGCDNKQIIFRYIFMNILPQLIVFASLNFSSAMLRFSGLAFLGLGVKPPRPELGLMLSESKDYMQLAPSYMIYTGFALFFTVFVFNFFADYMQDYLNYKKDSLMS